MNKEQTKIWKDACKKEEKAKGYVPAELLMLPMLLGLTEEGEIDIAVDGENTIIASKGILSKKGK
jgi:hypothetical protein|tara:strand:+ start:1071 stop:1265 length:195 start_codon:yes stop_codon:yes gene_type:complete